MIFELDEEHVGDWDNFQIRKIGFKVQRGLSEEEKKGLDERSRRVILKLGS